MFEMLSRSNASAQARFYLDNGMRETNVRALLPCEADPSFQSYAARVANMSRSPSFALLFNNPESIHKPLWTRLRGFCASLYEQVGLGYGASALFCGTYPQTPFGLHKDQHNSFIFVLSGRKRIRVWPYKVFERFTRGEGSPKVRTDFSYMSAKLPDVEYQEFLDSSILLEGGPGDVLYWPVDRWHVGVGDGSPAMSLHVAFEFGGDETFAAATRELAQVVSNELGSEQILRWPAFSPRRLQHHAASVPKCLRLTLRAARNCHRDFERSVRAAWARHVTSLGLCSCPIETTSVGRSDVLVGDPAYPIVVVSRNAEMLCAANGHSITITAHPSVRKLIKLLNSGTQIDVRQLIRDCSPRKASHSDLRASPAAILKLASVFCSWGAVRKLERV